MKWLSYVSFLEVQNHEIFNIFAILGSGSLAHHIRTFFTLCFLGLFLTRISILRSKKEATYCLELLIKNFLVSAVFVMCHSMIYNKIGCIVTNVRLLTFCFISERFRRLKTSGEHRKATRLENSWNTFLLRHAT